MSATPDREPTTDSHKNTGKVSSASQLNLIGITYRSMGELLLTGAVRRQTKSFPREDKKPVLHCAAL